MSLNLKDYINDRHASIIEKAGVIGVDKEFTKLYEMYVIRVETHVALLHLPEKDEVTDEDRLDIMPDGMCTEVADLIDLRFPGMQIVAKAILWLELCSALHTAAERFFVQKARDKYLKDAGLKNFMDILRNLKSKYGRNS